MDRNFYQLLGIDPTASAEEVEAAYRARKAAAEAGEPGAPEVPWLEAAYDVLAREDQRKVYDSCLKTGADFAQQIVELKLLSPAEAEARLAELERVAAEARQAWAMRVAARERRAAEQAELAAHGGDVTWLLRRRIEELDQAIEWRDQPGAAEGFDLVLVGEKDPCRYTLRIRIVDLISPDDLETLTQGADARRGEPGETPEVHAYLLIGSGFEVQAQVLALARGFNARAWGMADEAGTRAFVATLDLHAGRPEVPGVPRPDPRLDRLVLLGAAPAPAEGAGTVLVVDDDPLVLQVLADLLGSQGYRVHTAENWDQCRQAVSVFDPEVLLLDLNMPGVSGPAMALYLKNFYPDSGPRVVFHSGAPERELRRTTRRLGALNYLCKGSSDDRVLRVVAAAVQDYRGGEDTPEG